MCERLCCFSSLLALERCATTTEASVAAAATMDEKIEGNGAFFPSSLFMDATREDTLLREKDGNFLKNALTCLTELPPSLSTPSFMEEMAAIFWHMICYIYIYIHIALNGELHPNQSWWLKHRGLAMHSKAPALKDATCRQ